MQINSAPTTPTPATVDLISELPSRSSSPTTHSLLPRYSRKQVGNDDLIASIDQVSQKLADCLSLMESALTTLVRRRPPSSSDLSEADREIPGDTTTIHQDALRDKFADQIGDIYPLVDPIVDQLSPAVNMLQIGQRPEESLHTILEVASTNMPGSLLTS